MLGSELDAVSFTTEDGLTVPGSWLWDPASAPPQALQLGDVLQQTGLASVSGTLALRRDGQQGRPGGGGGPQLAAPRLPWCHWRTCCIPPPLPLRDAAREAGSLMS